MASDVSHTRKSFARAMFVTFVLLLSMALAACSSADEPVDDAYPSSGNPTDATQAPADPTTDTSLSEWFEGSWTVDFTLTSIDPDADWSRAAADQPTASWKCRVDGYDMVIDADLHVYTGSLTDQGDGTWIYDGTATYLDEEGVEWTSHIVVTGTRDSDDSFSAEQWGEISSSTDGVLYTATWDAAGTRTPQ